MTSENQPSRDAIRDLGSVESGALEAAGRLFVTQLGLLLKLAVVHDAANDALLKPAHHLGEAVLRLLDLDPQWSLRMIHEQLFINQTRLRLDKDVHLIYLHVVGELTRRGIGTIRLTRPPVEQEAIAFAYLLQAKSGDGSFSSLAAAVADRGLGFIGLEPLREQILHPDQRARQRTRAMARETFFGAVFMTGGLFTSIEAQTVINTRRARRVIQSFLDILNIDEDYFLGMTSIKNYDEYTFNHSVNVTILALNMGRRLGLSRTQLTDLGLSAVFHDIGKVALPHDLVNKEDALDDREWETMHRHPVEGVKKLLRLKGFSELTVKLILSVYEHHQNYDFSGYPELPVAGRTNLFSRILRIVDSYDAMTTRRVYRRSSKHPVAALEEIWNLSGRNFDPDLVKLFIRIMGLYPIGTVVQISSGEIGLVIGRPRTDLPSRPLVRIVGSWSGETVPAEESFIDLAESTDRTVIGYYDLLPSQVNPAWYLLTLEHPFGDRPPAS